MLVDSRLERPLPLSWEQHIAICTQQSAYILALLAAPRATFLLRLSLCDKAAGPRPGQGYMTANCPNDRFSR
jgi:hypothetical protein